MAKTFKVVAPITDAFSIPRIVASGAVATIASGTPTKEGSSGAVAIMTDGNGTTSERFSGIAKNTSTDTAAANGVVRTILPLPGIIYVGSPKVADAANTRAKIDALQGKRVVFDLTSSDWTVDSAAGDSATNGVVIVDGQLEGDVLHFLMSPTVTMLE